MIIRSSADGKTIRRKKILDDSNWFAMDGATIETISPQERADTGLEVGDKITIQGCHRHVRLNTRYRVTIAKEPKDWQGHPQYRVLSMAQYVQSASAMKAAIKDDSLVTEEDVTAIIKEFGWSKTLAAIQSPTCTSDYERLTRCLNTDPEVADAKIDRLRERFCGDLWADRIRDYMPLLSETVVEKLAKKIESGHDPMLYALPHAKERFDWIYELPYRIILLTDVCNQNNWEAIDKTVMSRKDIHIDETTRIAFALLSYMPTLAKDSDTYFKPAQLNQEHMLRKFCDKKFEYRSNPRKLPQYRVKKLLPKAIRLLVTKGLLVARKHGDSIALVPTSVDLNEQTIADRIRDNHTPHDFDEIKANDAIDQYMALTGRTLDASQRQAVMTALGNTFSCIVGRAGYGKSATIDAVAWCMGRCSKTSKHEPLIVALSGRAAQRVRDENVLGDGARTSLAHPGYKNTNVRTIAWALMHPDVVESATTLIIDEASMCSVSNLGPLFATIPSDVRIVFAGDDAQLQPITEGQPLLDIMKMADNQRTKIAMTELTVNYRQKSRDPELADALEHIRNGKTEAFRELESALATQPSAPVRLHTFAPHDTTDMRDALGIICDNYSDLVRRSSPKETITLSTNKSPKHGHKLLNTTIINAAIRERENPDNGTEPIRLQGIREYWQTFHFDEQGKTICLKNKTDDESINVTFNNNAEKGDEAAAKDCKQLFEKLGLPLYRLYENVIHPDAMSNLSLCFRIGDRVMCSKNDSELCVYNGDRGTILAVDCKADLLQDSYVTVKLDRGPIVKIDVGVFSTHWQLGYCVTVHKAQGSQYDHVIFALGMPYMGNRSMIYTAASRAKKSITIVGISREIDNAIRKLPDQRNTLLEDRVSNIATEIQLI